MSTSTTTSTTSTNTLTTKITISKAGKMTVAVSNVSRVALGKMINMMNGQEIRGSVPKCGFILWAEKEETRKKALASGSFTVDYGNEESLDQVSRKLDKLIKEYH